MASPDPLTPVQNFEVGLNTFSVLFTRWMDSNGWSHPVMTALAKAALGNTGWLHSSQISALRHGTLRSPGPRTFIAIERLNYYLWRYREEKLLIPNTPHSRAYSDPYPITEDGLPPPVGWWVEVFCGTRVPKDFQESIRIFSASQVENFSTNWSKQMRSLMMAQGIDIVDELDAVVRKYYPAGDNERVSKLKDVLTRRAVWSPDEFVYEIPALVAMTAELDGEMTEEQFLSQFS
jgi:hypothetical protein